LHAITNRYVALAALAVMPVVAWRPAPAVATDPENCLSCHRYRGLSRIDKDGETVHLYYVNPSYYDHALGPHARLRCTDCHERSEVAVVPHARVTPVDCTRMCHLVDSRHVEIRFAHSDLVKALESSVHSAEELDESNKLLGEPLRPGQARCLLCHDEPKFRWSDQTWASDEAPIQRCHVCHTEALPVNPRYAYWHVFARSRPARSHKDLTRVCGMCHANPTFQAALGMANATASYLASFHGKAMQLGSETTANCLDCHVAELENVHLMRAAEDPTAPTSPAHLADTCRSAACHPTAGHRVSSAAVHLQLTRGRGIERGVAIFFVLLIVVTFGPSVVLHTLELLQVAVGRHDPAYHERLKLARKLIGRPDSRFRLHRFTPHQRLQHWVLFLCFSFLCATGFPLKFADRAWAAWVVDVMGGLSLTRLIHRWAGVVLITGFVYHMLYVGVFVVRDKRRTGKGWFRTLVSLPMVVTWTDLKQLYHLLGYLLFLQKTRPEGGRFSLKEKFEYFGVFWGCTLLGMTGILMWANAWTTQHLTGRVLTVAALIHTFEAFLALLHVGVIHIIGVIFAPHVFPVSPAMVTGNTPAEELAEAHAGLLRDVAAQSEKPAGGEVSHV
jgi:cytochrome b subunit of formate dehydrogenase